MCDNSHTPPPPDSANACHLPAVNHARRPRCQHVIMLPCRQDSPPSGCPSCQPVRPTDCSAPKHRLGEMSDANLYCSWSLVSCRTDRLAAASVKRLNDGKCAISTHTEPLRTSGDTTREGEVTGKGKGIEPRHTTPLGRLDSGSKNGNATRRWIHQVASKTRQNGEWTNRSQTARSPARSTPGSAGQQRCRGRGIGPAEREPHHRFQQ